MHAAHRRVLRFNPRTLFHGGVAGGFWDVSDRKTLFQDAAMTTPVAAPDDPVGAIMDKSGNGNHLLQVGADGTRPLYKSSGGLHWVEGDGTDDFLRAVFTVAQPIERISAIQQVTWTANDFIFGGGDANACVLSQITSSPTIRVFSGSSVSVAGPAVGANAVITERHSATGRVAVNNGAYANGSTGTTLPGGITLFASQIGTAPANARFYAGIMRSGLMSDVQINHVRRYMAIKAGVAL